MNRALIAMLLLLPCAALAWPVDQVFDLTPGTSRMVQTIDVAWAESDSPSVVRVTIFPHQVVLTPVGNGRALVLLYEQGRAAVWRVRVGDAAQGADAEPTPALQAVKKACSKLAVDRTAGVAHVSGTIDSEACRLAARALFQTDFVLGKALDLSFELPVLQSQLRDLMEGIQKIDAQAQAVYVGAGLELDGQATEAQRHALLWEIFRRAAGRVPLDDEMTAPEAPQP